MAQLLILTSAVEGDVLPSLALLSHRVRSIPAEPASLINAPATDLIFVDARHDLASAKSLCKILTTTGLNVPLVLVLTEGGLTAVSADWGADDVVLESAGPAELDARIRLVIGRLAAEKTGSKIQASGVTIGILGVLAFRAGLGFRAATTIAVTTFLGGDAIGHVRQMIVAHNFAPGNAGPWFWTDVLVPLVMVASLAGLYRRQSGVQRTSDPDSADRSPLPSA